MSLIVCLALMPGALSARSAPVVPVFRAGLDGVLSLRNGAFSPTFRPGTRTARIKGVTGFAFDGRDGGIGLGDPPALQITKSLTIASWVFLEAYAAQGVEAQIVFRGDDRGGLDPYSLRTLADGTVAFTIENARGQADRVAAPIPLRRWTHVLGSLDDRTGEMTLWVNGVKVGHHRTSVRPLGPLKAESGAGVCIGNVQTKGSYNQPLSGIVADVGIYDRAVTPDEIKFSFSGIGISNEGFHSPAFGSPGSGGG